MGTHEQMALLWHSGIKKRMRVYTVCMYGITMLTIFPLALTMSSSQRPSTVGFSTPVY